MGLATSSHSSSVDQPGCGGKLSQVKQNVVLSSPSVHLFPPSSPPSPSSLPSQPLPATAAAFTIPKELAGLARTEDGDRDVQRSAHHPCTKEAETFKSTTTPTRPSIIA